MQKTTLRYACFFFLSLLFSACSPEGQESTPLPSSSPNILLIIADDLGKDALSGYAEGSLKPNTPHLDALRNSGLLFNNFWVYPTCSPTRASIITGKYGYRTGVKWASDVLSSSETTLQRHIANQTGGKYATAVIGKWHLVGRNMTFNPEELGIDHYAGLIAGATDYFQWNLTEDGASTPQTTYITEKFTDLSIDWINAQEKPWFLWLAYTAPHTPFHLPPSEMHSQTGLPEYTEGMDATPYFMAAIEAMDYQIGRLLENIPAEERENTLVIFVGDNGTTDQVAQAPYVRGKVKGSLYQGGINTPVFVSGAGVSRRGTDDNLLCSTDLFATLAEFAGASGSAVQDSKSFLDLFSTNSPVRNFQYCEMNDGNEDSWTISNGQYKLIVRASGAEEMYALSGDPYENNNLLTGALSAEAQAAKTALEAELAIIRQ